MASAGRLVIAADEVVMENECLKVTISPVGGKILSLYNKVQKREEVKILPYVSGMNLIRFGSALNIDDMTTRYELQRTQLLAIRDLGTYPSAVLEEMLTQLDADQLSLELRSTA